MVTKRDIMQFPGKGRDCDWRPVAIFGIKAVHRIAFVIIQSAIVFLFYKAVRRQTDRKAGIAASIAIGECAIFAGNGFRCPLTDLAEELGSDHGAVIDIFLPRWLAANIGRIYGPLLLVALVLHARNFSKRRSPALDGLRPASADARE